VLVRAVSTAAVNLCAVDPLTPGDAGGHIMDHDRIEGSAKQIKGQVKDTAGKLTGDSKLQAEGKADKAEGKVQNTVGGVKDKIRDALD
jgi:uncharacterized protein YjbJ (UPF0337 family)